MKRISLIFSLIIVMLSMPLLSCGLEETPIVISPTVDPSISQETEISPQGISVTDENSVNPKSDSIQINWKSETTIEGVRLYWYSDLKTAESAELAMRIELFEMVTVNADNVTSKLSATQSSYLHEGLSVGDILYFIIVFYAENDRLMGVSKPQYGSTARLPQKVEASKNLSEPKITLSWEWNGEWECLSFNLYRCATVDGTYSLLVDNIDSSLRFYSDETLMVGNLGLSLFYKVSAITTSGESLKSNSALGKTLLEGVLSEPLNLTASDTFYRDSIELTWDAPSSRVAEVTRYLIYSKMGDEWSSIPIDAGSNLSWSYSVDHSNEISFYVCADSSFGEGAPSSTVIGSAIPSVTGLSATYMSSETATTISWDAASISSGETKYNVYRSTLSTLDGTADLLTSSPISETSLADSTGEAGGKFYYFASVVNETSAEEGIVNDSAVGVRGEVPKPDFTVSQGTLNDIQLNFSNAKSYLTISITASRASYAPEFFGKPMFNTNDGEVPTDYDNSLEYKNNPNQSYSALSSVLTSHTETSWSDYSSSPGWNRYQIQYHYLDEIHSVLSDEKKGYRKLTDSEFLTEFLQTIARSQYKMYNIHQGGLDANGSDGPYDGDITGEVFYDASFSIWTMKATVPIYYTNYHDYDLIINDISGNVQTSIANTSADGILQGGNVTSGLYEGEVIFNLTVTGGKKTAGDYTVRQKSGDIWSDQVTITWDYDRADVELYLTSYPY